MCERIPLKFENTAEVGDIIKAFDFEPMPGRIDVYLIGKVTAKGMTVMGYNGYTIDVTAVSGIEPPRHPMAMCVPFQISPLDYDGRVTLVRRAVVQCAEERADLEGTDPADERAADQDHALRVTDPEFWPTD